VATFERIIKAAALAVNKGPERMPCMLIGPACCILRGFQFQVNHDRHEGARPGSVDRQEFLEENKMKRLEIKALVAGMAVVALVAAAACNRGAGATPTATFTAYYEASKNKDIEAVKKTFSKNTLELFERQAKDRKTTVDEMFKTGMDQKPLTGKVPEVRNEKINGNDATLEIKDEQSGRWDTLTFVKEDGQWKIALDKMGSQTPAS
jgi:hypothetical protein